MKPDYNEETELFTIEGLNFTFDDVEDAALFREDNKLTEAFIIDTDEDEYFLDENDGYVLVEVNITSKETGNQYLIEMVYLDDYETFSQVNDVYML